MERLKQETFKYQHGRHMHTISQAINTRHAITEMCSDSEAGSYLRLIDFVYHSTLGLRVIKKRKCDQLSIDPAQVSSRVGLSLSRCVEAALRGQQTVD